MIRTGLVFALVTLASAKDEVSAVEAPERRLSKQQCVTMEGVYWGLTAPQFMNHFLGSIARSTKATSVSNPSFADNVMNKGKCQWDCVQDVFSASAKVIWGSKLLIPTHRNFAKELVKDMLTASMKACYPDVLYDHATTIAEKVLDSMVEPPTPNDDLVVDFHINATCPGASEKGSLDNLLDQFNQCLPATLDRPRFKDLKAYITGKTSPVYDCQEICFDTTSKRALTNLWEAGLYRSVPGGKMFLEAMTGAIRACYPSLQRDVVLGFVEEIEGCLSQKKKCLPPAKEIAGINQGKYLGMILPEVACAVKHTISTNPSFKATFDQKGSCQWDCAKGALEESAKILWGTGWATAKNLDDKIPVHMMTGAIKTCYPGVKIEDATGVAEEVEKTFQDKAHKDSKFCEVQIGKQCPGSSPGSEAEFKQMSTNAFGCLKSTMGKPKFAPLEKWLDDNAFVCQDECLEKTIDLSLQNLWKSGLFGTVSNHGMMKQSFTGAIRTCFPRVPRTDVTEFVEAAVSCLSVKAPPANENKDCIAADAHIPKAGGMDEGHYLALFHKATLLSVSGMLAKLPSFAKVFNDRGSCQWTCLQDVLRESAKTMWGTQMIFGRTSVASRMVDALTGAIKACYPQATNSDAFNVAANLTDEVWLFTDNPNHAITEHRIVTVAKQCAKDISAPDLMSPDYQAYSSVMKDFTTSTVSTLKGANFKAMNAHLFGGSYKCQGDCLKQTLQVSMRTLWESGSFGSMTHGKDAGHHEAMVQSFAGAMESCYPELDRDQVMRFAQQSMKDVAEKLRLYTASMPQVAAQIQPQASQPQTLVTTFASVALSGMAVVFALIFTSLIVRKFRKNSSNGARVARSFSMVDEMEGGQQLLE